jgi:peptidyl-dipeptidase A
MNPAAALALLPLLLASAPAEAAPAAQERAERFLAVYNSVYTGLATVASENAWKSSTDVRPENEGRRVAAEEAYAAFVGDPAIIAEVDALLADRAALTPLQLRQLTKIKANASSAPGSMRPVVARRIAAEAQAAAVQDSFVFCLEAVPAGQACPAPLTANDIDAKLSTVTDLAERQRVWEASKRIGVPLKPHLVELRGLRNQIARASGYSSYFGLMTADYGMSADEMMTLLDGIVRDVKPLYDALGTYGRDQLAARYGVSPPSGPMPAHWAPNRWGQEWTGLVPGIDLDPYFAQRTPEWIVRTSEQFYTGIGMQPLPESFWTLSDLYPVPAGVDRHKNSHASAWHIDLHQDVRSLMSVQADAGWFFTTHHELGHIYYDLAYARPEVPPVLREGANRAFHEGVGELISVAASQVPYLKKIGVLPKNTKINLTQIMLEEALTRTVVFLPWSAGVMSRFEYELYEKDLPPEQWQRRWWELVEQHQGMAPPTPDRRTDPSLCDACTKTHIIDDPAGYYDYALATVIKYQLHEHIATKILKQDPRSCDYSGNKEVGAYLQRILEKGATEDWRVVLQEATGEPLSTRAMLAYYKPLLDTLQKQQRTR